MDNELDDLNDLVSELKKTKSLTNIMAPPKVEDTSTKPEEVDDSNIDNFIYKKAAILIQQGVDTIESIKGTVLSGSDAETIEAYSKLMTSVATSIEILNKINLQKRKEKAAKELKQMEIDTSKRLLDKYGETPRIQNQTNILVASREEIMKALVNRADIIVSEKEVEEDKNTIDVNPQ